MVFGEIFLLELGGSRSFAAISYAMFESRRALVWIRFNSPATSCRRALWKAVPLLLTT